MNYVSFSQTYVTFLICKALTLFYNSLNQIRRVKVTKLQETRTTATSNRKGKRKMKREILKTKFNNNGEELGKSLSNFFSNTKISIN